MNHTDGEKRICKFCFLCPLKALPSPHRTDSGEEDITSAYLSIPTLQYTRTSNEIHTCIYSRRNMYGKQRRLSIDLSLIYPSISNCLSRATE